MSSEPILPGSWRFRAWIVLILLFAIVLAA